MFQITTAVHKINALKKRLRVIQGGTSAGKTIAILLLLIDLAMKYPNLLISVVAVSVPHLKRGAMRDFLKIMRTQNYFDPRCWNATDHTYTFENGSMIEFFSAGDPEDLRGGRRDVLFMNECNNLKIRAFDELEVRTNHLVILDYNPVAEFWAHTDIIPNRDHDFLILTYKDNEALDAQIIESIEARKNNLNWWTVYGLGQVGIKEGVIYPNWKHIDKVPEEARLIRYGIDFGYTNDPTAIIALYEWNQALIIRQIAYATKMSNRQIANELRLFEGLEPVAEYEAPHGETSVLAIADSEDPRTIDDIKRFGVKITGAIKGPGSVNLGIELVQEQEIYVTDDSLDIWHEQQNYLWRVDKSGKSLNVPEEGFDHSPDAIRYAVSDARRRRQVAKVHLRKPAGF